MIVQRKFELVNLRAWKIQVTYFILNAKIDYLYNNPE